MKVVILFGRRLTQINEDISLSSPKHMVEMNGMPNLWYILKIYTPIDTIIFFSSLSYIIKDYLTNQFLSQFLVKSCSFNEKIITNVIFANHIGRCML